MLVWQSLCRRLVDTWYEVSRIDLSMLIMGAVLGSMLFDFLFLFLILHPPYALIQIVLHVLILNVFLILT
jgi:hypothetical protein